MCQVLACSDSFFCSFTVYAASDKIGSPSKMFDNLVIAARASPIDGNRGGSFLTFWSESGVKFGILQTISCWGITIVDQASLLRDPTCHEYIISCSLMSFRIFLKHLLGEDL